jgi:hypothetical protein
LRNRCASRQSGAKSDLINFLRFGQTRTPPPASERASLRL